MSVALGVDATGGLTTPATEITGRVLPVRGELADLLPWGGLRRGSTVSVRGSTSLLLALLATATAEGCWAAVVGLPHLGVLAAAELGVAVHRLALVPQPGTDPAVVERTVAPNLRVIRATASNTAGKATLSLPPGGRGTEGRASLEGLSDSTSNVEVETVRIDDLDLGPAVFMKVDVEGHELAALRGAAGLIQASHPILTVEIEQRHGGIAPTVDLLAGWGYTGRVLVDDRWTKLTDFDLAAHQEKYFADHEPASYVGIMLRKEKYINNVVFTHEASTVTLV